MASRTISAVIFATLLLSPLRLAYADTNLATIREGKIQITVEESHKNAQEILTIPMPGGIDAKSVVITHLSGPGRLVIDFPNLKIGKNYTVTLAHHPFIKTIRVGTHPDKIRLVFDLKVAEVPHFLNISEGDKLVLRFTGVLTTEEAAETAIATPTPLLPVPTITPLLTLTPKATLIAPETVTPTPSASPVLVPLRVMATPTATPQEVFPTEVPSPEPTERDTPAAVVSADETKIESPYLIPASATPTLAISYLEGIEFGYLGAERAAVARIKLNVRPQFKLSRVSDKSYVLTLPDVALRGPYLRLPQFPPRDFPGVTVISVESSNNETRITVGVEYGVRIAAVAHEMEILIKPLNR